MRPHDDDLDDEIRGHLAISIKERIERGEDPASARLAALKEFGNLTLTRDSMRSVWRYGWPDAADALARDLRFALRALLRARGLAATVGVPLQPGSSANYAIFSVVRAATVVGVREPSVPYPTDTEIIANVVTSPHHLGATMVTRRTHRMTELFGRLAPGATVEAARAELTAAYAATVRAHPEAYSP